MPAANLPAMQGLPYPPGFLVPGREDVALAALPALETRLAVDRLLPIAYLRLRERLEADPALAPLAARWKHAWQVTLAQNLHALAEVEAVAAACHQPLVLLKGAALIGVVHPDPGARPMQDVDVLIAPADRAAVARALADRGFAPPPDTPGARYNAGLGRADFRKGPLCVELHTALEWTLVALDAEGMRARAVPPAAGPLAGAPGIHVLAPEDAFLYGVVHWVTHWRSHTYGLWPWELARMTELLPLDWDAVTARARAVDLAFCLHVALGMLEERWGARIPPAVRTATRPGPLLRMAARALERRPTALSLLLMHPLRLLFPGRARLQAWRHRGGWPRYLASLLQRTRSRAE